MSEQITHQEIDGDILPPDPHQLAGDAPNAPRMFFDRYNPHNPPDVGGTLASHETTSDQVGQLTFSTPMPQKLKDLKNSLPKHKPRKTDGDTLRYLKSRGK